MDNWYDELRPPKIVNLLQSLLHKIHVKEFATKHYNPGAISDEYPFIKIYRLLAPREYPLSRGVLACGRNLIYDVGTVCHQDGDQDGDTSGATLTGLEAKLPSTHPRSFPAALKQYERVVSVQRLRTNCFNFLSAMMIMFSVMLKSFIRTGELNRGYVKGFYARSDRRVFENL